MPRIVSLLACLVIAAPVVGQPSPYPVGPYAVLETGGPSAVVRRLAFTPDGKYLLLAGKDKVLRIWDVAAAQTVRVIRPPIGPGSGGVLQALAVAPDGKKVAIGGQTRADNKTGTLVYLVALDSGRIERTFQGLTGNINSVAFASDGSQLAVCDYTGTVGIYDVADGRLKLSIRAGDIAVRHVAFSPDGSKLATIGFDTSAKVWSASAGKLEAQLQDGKVSARNVAWKSDGKLLAVGNREGTVSLFEPDGTLRMTLNSSGASDITSVAFTPDGREVLVTSVNQTTSLINVETGKPRNTNRLHNNTIQHGAISPDGRFAATTGNDDHETYLWRTDDFRMVSVIAGSARMPKNVGWAPDGKTILWNHLKRPTDPALDRSFRAFDLETLRFTEAGKEKAVRLVHQQGKRTLHNINREYLQIKEGQEVVGTLKPPAGFGRVNAYSWLKDGRIVVGGSVGLILMDAATGDVERRFVGHSDEILALVPSPDGRYFLSVSIDLTIRIWSPESGKPVLSLFFADPDWIAWTEEGYYACSANGERLIGWHVNNELSEAANYYPAAQFRRSLYQPEMIRNVLASGSVAEAFKKIGKKASAIESIADVMPPRVTITSPTGLGTVRVAETKLNVTALAQSTGKNPVTALRLLVDGRPFGGKEGVRTISKPALGEVKAAWTVDLPAGVHHFAVVAESAVSRALSQGVEVSVEGTKTAKPNLYVLAVGISNYPSPLQLDYAADDADGIVAALKQQGRDLYGTIEVQLVKDRKASKVGIEDGLAWLASKMTPQDVGVFFYAGHGSRDKDGGFYMITVDANTNDVPGTCISGEFIKAKMGEMPGRLIAMLDTCHSGAAREKVVGGETPDDLIRDLVGEDYGVIVMSSSLGQEVSMESSKLGQGFFTYSLMKGLEGFADTNKDGVVYLGELDAFATRIVRTLSGGYQNPIVARPATVHSFPLATCEIKPSVAATSTPPPKTPTAKEPPPTPVVRPAPVDPMKALQLDERLQAKLTLRFRYPRPQHFLDYFRKATGLDFTLDENVEKDRAILGNTVWEDKPAWQIMFDLTSRVPGSWEKVTGGYLLKGVKLKLTATSYPPFIDDTNDPLLNDPRLEVKVVIQNRTFRVNEFLEALRESTGLTFTCEKIDTKAPFINTAYTNKPAKDAMRRFADMPRIKGTWEKTADGYRLLGTNTEPTLPPKSASTPPPKAAPPPPVTAEPERTDLNGWVVGGGSAGVALCLGFALLMWRRKKPVSSPRSKTATLAHGQNGARYQTERATAPNVANQEDSSISKKAAKPARKAAVSVSKGAEAASTRIDARIRELGDWRGAVLDKVRRIIKDVAPEIVEEWKTVKPTNPGIPVWSYLGIICTGETYKERVRLTFAKGVSLPDPSGLFNASLDGNVRRAIDIRETDEIDETALTDLIRAAVALNRKERRV